MLPLAMALAQFVNTLVFFPSRQPHPFRQK